MTPSAPTPGSQEHPVVAPAEAGGGLPILPGETVGVVGGGQLGRMFAYAAHRMGYCVHVLDPDPQSPAGRVADRHFCAPFDDMGQLRDFGSSCAVVTVEFENIPAAALQAIARVTRTAPGWRVLHTCQNREREKNFLADNGFPHTPFRTVDNADELEEAVHALGRPCVLKSSDFGYDGKGQTLITSETKIVRAWEESRHPRGVVEAWVNYTHEFSVICARAESGEVRCYPAAENVHEGGILDTTLVPARIPNHIHDQARTLAEAITTRLDVVGLLAVEMFLDQEERILVNELAPRPHNSGHHTIEAVATDQFEQLLRAVAGLPLGSTELRHPAVMINLLGDRWAGGTPDWPAILELPGVHLHLYGKTDPRPGRKMGHVTAIDDSLDLAIEKADRIRELLHVGKVENKGCR